MTQDRKKAGGQPGQVTRRDEAAPSPQDRDKEPPFLYASYTGPVPPPGYLERYEAVYPGAAEEIFNNWKVQSDHRRSLESSVVGADIEAEKLGMKLGFVLATLIVILGFILILEGKDIYGLIALLTPVIILTGLFVYSRNREPKELAANRPRLPREEDDDE